MSWAQSTALSPSWVNNDTHNVTFTTAPGFVTIPTLPVVVLEGGTDEGDEENANG